MWYYVERLHLTSPKIGSIQEISTKDAANSGRFESTLSRTGIWNQNHFLKTSQNQLLISNMGLSENSVPLNPMVNDHYPNIPYFQTNPHSSQTSSCVSCFENSANMMVGMVGASCQVEGFTKELLISAASFSPFPPGVVYWTAIWNSRNLVATQKLRTIDYQVCWYRSKIVIPQSMWKLWQKHVPNQPKKNDPKYPISITYNNHLQYIYNPLINPHLCSWHKVSSMDFSNRTLGRHFIAQGTKNRHRKSARLR